MPGCCACRRWRSARKRSKGRRRSSPARRSLSCLPRPAGTRGARAEKLRVAAIRCAGAEQHVVWRRAAGACITTADFARPRFAALLDDRAERRCWRGSRSALPVADLQRADHAVAADVAGDVPAPALEARADESDVADIAERQLRIAVQLVTRRGAATRCVEQVSQLAMGGVAGISGPVSSAGRQSSMV